MSNALEMYTNTTRDELPLFLAWSSLWDTSSRLQVVEWCLRNPEFRLQSKLLYS